MKNTTTNNRIFSRVKENFKGFLSIFDATDDVKEEEIQLPEELKSSLKTLDLQARSYEENGTLFVKKPENSKTQTRVNKIKPAKAISKDKSFTRNIDDEREI